MIVKTVMLIRVKHVIQLRRTITYIGYEDRKRRVLCIYSAEYVDGYYSYNENDTYSPSLDIIKLLNTFDTLLL